MIDILLLVQVSWCFVWLSQKRAQNALLYAGGIVSAGYVAWQTTGWVSTWLTAPSNPAFLWLQNNLATTAQAVSVLGRFVPPQPVDTSMAQTHWISLHVARGLIFCATTFAVFITFAIVQSLRGAIWDLHQHQASGRRRLSFASATIGAASSLYTCIITMMLVTNIAWIHPFQGLVPLIGQSIGLHWYSTFLGHP